MTTKSRLVIFLFIIILLLTGLACSLSSGNGDNSTGNVATATATFTETAPDSVPVESVPVVPAQNPVVSPELEGILIDLYQRTNLSVVDILNYSNASDPYPTSSGSGFVYDAEGHIVTNNHVVEDGAAFEVIFADGNRRRAEVIGKDVDSDLAVIQVESLPEGALPLALGNSEQIQVGQLVVTIGNPFGEQSSMAMGIISGLSRSLDSQRALEDPTLRYSLPEIIQTDSPINPGNSGGPLLNLQGEVLGVNSAILSTTGFNSGVGFSIPVNAVRRIVPSLITNGVYVYSYMGVQISSLNLNLQERYDVPQVNGAYVVGVTPGGPADEAGLVAADETNRLGGDLITEIDGQPIMDTEQLIAFLVFNTEVGQTVNLTVIRGNDTITVPLTLAARP
ncbi:MAG: trypsin-like peptidase domain-containing protein [Candidatus Promineifilaceae bacterium]